MSADVSFYRTRDAFPHTRLEDRDADLVVSVQPHGEPHSNYEFIVTHVGTRRRDRGPIALRVGLFSDSWRAFTDLPEFFALLASLDETNRGDGRSALDLDALSLHLVSLGWTDKTDAYASQHEHVIGCIVCGDRLSAGEEGPL